MIVKTNFAKYSGPGTAMFSRAGKTTISQYMSFSDSSKTFDNRRETLDEVDEEYLDNYDTCFGNKLKMNNIRGIIRFDYLCFLFINMTVLLNLLQLLLK